MILLYVRLFFASTHNSAIRCGDTDDARGERIRNTSGWPPAAFSVHTWAAAPRDARVHLHARHRVYRVAEPETCVKRSREASGAATHGTAGRPAHCGCDAHALPRAGGGPAAHERTVTATAAGTGVHSHKARGATARPPRQAAATRATRLPYAYSARAHSHMPPPTPRPRLSTLTVRVCAAAGRLQRGPCQ